MSPSRRPRSLALATGLLLVLAALPWLAGRHAQAALLDRGFTWTAAGWTVRGYEIQGLARPGLEVDLVRLPWSWPQRPLVRGARVDLGGQTPDGGAAASVGSGGLDLLLEEVAVSFGDRRVAEGLSGHRTGGELVLGGPDTELRQDGDIYSLRASRPSPLEEVGGTVVVEAELDVAGPFQVRLETLDAVLRHPLLSARPLPLDQLSLGASGDWRRRQASGTLQVEWTSIDVEISCQSECWIVGEIAPWPASEVLHAFAPLVPELDRARVEGELGGTFTLLRRAGAWHLEAAELILVDLAVEGAVRDLDQLQYGPFTYRVRDATGGALVRATGEGTPDWVPLQQVSPWIVEAILSSEDAAFRRHRGYDAAQIREALVADLEAAEVVRGGSTLTQQLAKNLFLSADQTLERKLRELLLAVELDRRLGKSRVLELYLNVVEWGPEVWGIGPATDRYFLKRPERIQPHEAAFLAAILPAPRTFYEDWYLAGRGGSYEVDAVLTNMADLGAMSRRQAQHWSRQELRFVPPPRER